MRTTIIAILGLVGCTPTPYDLAPGVAISSCTFKLSGAASGSGDCTVEGGWGNQESKLSFTAADKNGSFSFLGDLASAKQFSPRTWNNGNVMAGGAQYHTGNPTWAFVLNATNHDPADQGSFSLTIDDPGMETAGSDSTVWLSPKGKLTVNMPAVPNSGASGETQAEISFK